MSKPLTARDIARIESCRDNTSWTAEQAARHLGYFLADVRRIYAEGKR